MKNQRLKKPGLTVNITVLPPLQTKTY